jgi:acetyl-CoA acetyltransferase
MADAYICDAIRTPFGRYGGTLATVRTDDLAALPLKALMERNKEVDWGAVDDVVYGCANQAGEDNRNVARMAVLLAGLPKEVRQHGEPPCGSSWTRSALPPARSSRVKQSS